MEKCIDFHGKKVVKATTKQKDYFCYISDGKRHNLITGRESK